VIKQAGCHLRAASVVNTDEQNLGKAGRNIRLRSSYCRQAFACEALGK
jgi:hypothetical protein